MLRISPAAVSGAVRYLIQLGPGAQGAGAGLAPGLLPDARQHVGRHAQACAIRSCRRWTALVREGIDLVGPDTPAGARLAEQADFLEFVSKELSDVLDRWDRSGQAAEG